MWQHLLNVQNVVQQGLNQLNKLEDLQVEWELWFTCAKTVAKSPKSNQRSNN